MSAQLLLGSDFDIDDLTVDFLKDTYLPGLTLLGPDPSGGTTPKELPDSFFQYHVNQAMSRLEESTHIQILPKVIVNEHHDYHANDQVAYSFNRMFKKPVRSIQGVRVNYVNGQTVYNFPVEWVKLDSEGAQISLVPSAGTLGQLAYGQGVDYLTFIQLGVHYLPGVWELDYTAGFDPEHVPLMIIDALCKLAVVNMLTIISNTINPIGQQSSSLSVDGLSQSRSFIQPAFKPLIDMYAADLGLPGAGATPNGADPLLKQIRNTYFGILMASL